MTTFTAKTAFLPLDNGLARREGVMNDGSPAAEVRSRPAPSASCKSPARAANPGDLR